MNLTREQIEKMEAGSELDAAISLMFEPNPPAVTAREARRDFNSFMWASRVDKSSPGRWWTANIGTDHGPEEDDDKLVLWQPADTYSDDIAAAALVVEAMIDRMWNFQWLPQAAVWQARFIDRIPILEVEAQNLPLAICRAALLSTLLGA